MYINHSFTVMIIFFPDHLFEDPFADYFAVNLFLPRNVKLEETFQDETKAKEVEKASMKCSQKIYDKKTASSLCLAREVGNMYTPSLYGCLASLLFRYNNLVCSVCWSSYLEWLFVFLKFPCPN